MESSIDDMLSCKIKCELECNLTRGTDLLKDLAEAVIQTNHGA